MKELKGVLLELPKISAQIQFFRGLNGEIGIKTINIGAESYKGAYEVTPSFEKQTLETAYRLLTKDVVVEPIPSNYGKISYDGSTLYIT